MSEKLRHIVRRGKAIGTVLTPHRFRDGLLAASPTHLERDFVRVRSERELVELARQGLKILMSNPKVPGHNVPVPVIAEIYEK
ncbi:MULTISPECIES: hypothetical protein [Microvirgula]|uniref:Uncharacterized protein n=1 Tax=Microvirgula aerodenitrificans TaxID=57480 RepID=A0A2S0P808_9NEIS|nr:MULTISPECIES: hypothetical protein [Microvirgula]AVY93518.1 hypothetical protein DAI18_05260 [Microvirgula aerodenitrificans]RAS20052.1 hypothetical protein DFO50_101442 [Microvirgula sp. AG722]